MVQSKVVRGLVAVEEFRGKLRLRWRYGGQRFSLSLGLLDTPENRSIAEVKAQKIEYDIKFDEFDPTLDKYRAKAILTIAKASPPKSVPALKDLWLQYVEYKSVNASPKTINSTYEPVTAYLKKIKTDGLKDAIKFRMELLQVTTQGQAKRALMQLSACCRWALKNRLIEHNPLDGMYLELEAPKPIPPMAFSAEERDRIIETFKNDSRKGINYRHYAPFVEFMFLTGCRPSEAIGLRWINITPDCGRIHFCESIVEVSGKLERRTETKTGIRRWFTCGERLQTLLQSIKPEVITDETLVFPSPKGKAIGLSNFNDRAWNTILNQLNLKIKDGVEMTAYNCRDTFITLQCVNGITSTQVARWVGNSSKVIEEKYLDFIGNKKVD